MEDASAFALGDEEEDPDAAKKGVRGSVVIARINLQAAVATGLEKAVQVCTGAQTDLDQITANLGEQVSSCGEDTSFAEEAKAQIEAVGAAVKEFKEMNFPVLQTAWETLGEEVKRMKSTTDQKGVSEKLESLNIRVQKEKQRVLNTPIKTAKGVISAKNKALRKGTMKTPASAQETPVPVRFQMLHQLASLELPGLGDSSIYRAKDGVNGALVTSMLKTQAVHDGVLILPFIKSAVKQVGGACGYGIVGCCSLGGRLRKWQEAFPLPQRSL